MCRVFFLKLKSETFESFTKFKALAENQSGHMLKVIRTDRGGEFLSADFKSFCEKHGVKHELTAPYSPGQNGVAERKNRTLVEMARCMMREKGLSNQFWAEGVATAVCISNISPTKAIWTGIKPSVSHLKVFGCICFALITTDRHKLESKSQKYIVVGYCTDTKAYRLFDPIKEKNVISRNVIFDEKLNWEESEARKVACPRFQEEQQTEDVPAANNLANSQHSTTVREQGNSDDSDSTPIKFRSLSDIYASALLCIVC